jgi:TRAP-type C4-dicarboxylate transport system permease small subunit
MSLLARRFYDLLLVLSCVSMVAALVAVMLGIVGRQIDWNLPGLDAYAGYSIAAALFLALPASLRHGDHIRVTLALDALPKRGRATLEYLCLVAGAGLALYLAWFSCKLVWVSYTVHDISPAADATPLWIPQLTMALGTIGFAVAMLHALLARWRGAEFFVAAGGAGPIE